MRVPMPVPVSVLVRVSVPACMRALCSGVRGLAAPEQGTPFVQRCAWQHPTVRTLRWHDATLARFVPRLTCVRIQATPNADYDYVMWRASP